MNSVRAVQIKQARSNHLGARIRVRLNVPIITSWYSIIVTELTPKM